MLEVEYKHIPLLTLDGAMVTRLGDLICSMYISNATYASLI
jgi:hypothetical protein